ncbi:MAG: DNA-binding protein [bacterium]|nr:DNA-binding protein [bacterium]
MAVSDLRTVKQVSRERPAFTEASLRWLIFNAEQNGLNRALVRIGRRLLIDLERFDQWLEEHRS